MTPETLTARTDATAATGRDSRPVYGYVRVSTDSQELARQERSIPEAHGRLPGGLSENELILFYDHGVSGYDPTAHRKGFEEMKTLLDSGAASALLVDTSSRLTRQGVEHALTFYFQLGHAQTRFFTTLGREYTQDTSGLIQLAIDSDRDQGFSRDLGHSIAGGKQTKLEQGLWHHGDVTVGYRNQEGQLVPTVDLPVITETFKAFLEGQTYKQLCAHVNANLSAEALARFKNGKVGRDRVRAWLQNPIYAGKLPHRGKLYDSEHAPAVSPETFARAQRKLREKARRFVRPPRSWPWSRIARCPIHKRSLQLHPTKNRHGRTYYYVRCTEDGCPHKHTEFNAAAFEASLVSALAATATVLGEYLAADPMFAVPTEQGPTPNEARASYAAATDRLQLLGQLVADGAMTTTDDKYLQAIRDRDEAEAVVERASGHAKSYRDELHEFVGTVTALADLAPSHPSYERMRLDDVQVTSATTGYVVTDHAVTRILEGWHAADFETQRNVVAKTTDAIYVDRSENSAVFEFRLGLPEPVTQRLALSASLDDDVRALRDTGWGRAHDARGQERPTGVVPVTSSLFRGSVQTNPLGVLETAAQRAILEARVALADLDFARAA